MKAVLWTKYGPPKLLRIIEIDKPTPGDNELLIKIHATTVNRTDCATIRAKPFFMRLVTGLFKPKKHIPGSEFSGEVKAVGKNITSFKTGDKVFGFDDEGAMSHARYMTITENRVVTMPDNISYEQAAASSEGAHYAYNFLNKVDLQKGQSVLVNGATGAIGSAAVQLLKYFGVNVTAVCAANNIELVKSLGAARVIDYTSQDFTEDEQQYHFVFDTVGKSSFFKCRRLLKPGGVYISSDLGFLAQNMYLPFITPLIKFLLSGKKTVFPYPSNIKRTLLFVKMLIERGEFNAVIDRQYNLDQIVDAYQYVETGHKTGNVVITVLNQ